MDVPSTGHRRQMSAKPMSESDSDAIDKERRCRLADGVTGKKKEPACLEGKQAGVNVARRNTAESRTDRSSYRVIEKAKGGPKNPETLDRCANPEDRPSLVDAILFLDL